MKKNRTRMVVAGVALAAVAFTAGAVAIGGGGEDRGRFDVAPTADVDAVDEEPEVSTTTAPPVTPTEAPPTTEAPPPAPAPAPPAAPMPAVGQYDGTTVTTVQGPHGPVYPDDYYEPPTTPTTWDPTGEAP
jgi:hypothetical protein